MSKIFSKRNKKLSNNTIINSKIGYTLKSKIIIKKGEEIIQTQYLTENYIITEAKNHIILYNPEHEAQYLVNNENKELKKIDISNQIRQINQLKLMIGEINTEKCSEKNKIAGYESYYLQLCNDKNKTINIDIKLWIANIKGLEKTVWHKFYQSEKNKQLFSLDLKPDEFITCMYSNLIMQGNEQKQVIELINVENKIENIEKLDNYLSYQIVSN